MQASFLMTMGASLRRTLQDRPSVSVGLCLALLLAALPAAAFAEDGAANGASAVWPAAGVAMAGMEMSATDYAAPSLETLPASSGELLDAGQGQTVTIHIRNLSFGSPLSVTPGATVEWVNDDTVTHTVTADDGTFDSGDLAPGATFRITFTQPGYYPYYCRFHGGSGGEGMSSMVTVAGQAETGGGQTNPPSGGANSSGKNAVPGYGSGMTTPEYRAPGSQPYGGKKPSAYASPAPTKKGYTSQSKSSYGAYQTGRYAAPSCRVPYTTSRHSRYWAYGYARPYGAKRAPIYTRPSMRRGY